MYRLRFITSTFDIPHLLSSLLPKKTFRIGNNSTYSDPKHFAIHFSFSSRELLLQPNIFVHVTSLDGIRLNEGDKVEYSEEDGKKGMERAGKME